MARGESDVTALLTLPFAYVTFFLFSVSSALLLVLAAALVLTIGVVTCIVSGRGMGGRPAGPAEPATAPVSRKHKNSRLEISAAELSK